jgi:dephospho-CoA kinase
LKNKIKIAITGSIGSGKSEFCRIVEKYGFPVIRSDEISKNILSNNENVKQKLLNVFGDIVFKDGAPNTKYLAEIVFNDFEKLKQLEEILHPLVIEEIRIKSKELLKENNVVFIESALVYEANIENEFDYVVLITAPRELRLKRKLDSGFNKEDFIKREKFQIPDTEKRKRADFIFVNNKSIQNLEEFFKIICLTLNIQY